MIQLSGSAGLQIKSGNGVHDNVWSDVEDCIPLKKRLKMLLESKRLSDFPDSESEKGSESPSAPPIDAVKTEDQQCDLQLMQGSNPSCFARDERNPGLSPEQSHTGVLRDYIYQGSEVNDGGNSNGIKVNEVSADTVLVEKVDTCASTSTQCSMLSKYPVKVGVGYADNNLTSSLGNGVEGFLGTHSQAVKIKTEIAEDFVDDLDYVVLKERRRLLLSRKSPELKKPVMDINFSWFSSSVVRDTIQNSIGIDKKENHSDDAESSVAGSHTHDVRERNASDLHKTSKSGTELQCSALVASCQGTYSAESGVVELQESDRICSSKKASTINESCGGQGFVSCNAHSMLTSALPSTFVNIKAEPMDYGDVYCFNKDALCNFPSSIIIPVKSELEILGESCEGNVDHMLLRDRIKLLASREAPNLDSSRNFKCSKKIVPSVLDCSPIVSRSAKPLRINRSRKRRKTATASVETALEEDAPGLLQVLIDKGVLINEIKLYGETENEEGLDDSSSEDNFSELEAVISKLFSQRQSLLKFAPIRCTKGEKASYCLACLISLVEQARYLQFRKWPVEWGWCRDLQSFIFVFKRHNRIVLERPEYGYATYFFELIDSLPIHWQIKRLVTAMKLTSCSRVTLIENKALLVGEDLSEGEARVLMEYGWIPNSGLGTMLNYCDRVVHDRKNESDVSEWRSKIGKLLMNGYDGGTIVSADIPKVVGCCGDRSPQIKLEL